MPKLTINDKKNILIDNISAKWLKMLDNTNVYYHVDTENSISDSLYHIINECLTDDEINELYEDID